MSVIVPDNVISKVQCATRTLGFSEPAKNHHGVPTRYCVLVGLKDIKFSPFTVRIFLWYYEALFLVFPYEVLCHCERSVAIPRKGTILNPTQDTFVLVGLKDIKFSPF